LVADDAVEPVGKPRTIPVGVLRWHETVKELTPRLVLDERYDVVTGASPEAGDGYRIVAEGQLTPLPLVVHRFVVGDPNVPISPAVGPVGIPVSGPALQRFEFVHADANFAAVLYRRDDESWQEYAGPTAATLSTVAGPIRLSINAITGVRPQTGGQSLPLPKSLLMTGSGKYRVSILVGKFDFPVDLDDRKRRYLLGKFD
jgi:hypothetical protein